MNHEPIIVVGTGRSGTSFVADVLHNDIGVCMGRQFRQPSKIGNPNGYYEDLAIVRLNRDFLSNYITLGKFIRSLSMFVEKQVSMGIPWGFKDPQISDLIGIYLSSFSDPKIIWCFRDLDAVLNSFIERSGWKANQDAAKTVIMGRHTYLNRMLSHRDHLKIMFPAGERLTRQHVAMLITDKWGIDG